MKRAKPIRLIPKLDEWGLLGDPDDPDDPLDEPAASLPREAFEHYVSRLRLSTVMDRLEPRDELTDHEKLAFTIRLWGRSAPNVHFMAASHVVLLVKFAMLATMAGEDCPFEEVAELMGKALKTRITKGNASNHLQAACTKLHCYPKEARGRLAGAIGLRLALL